MKKEFYRSNHAKKEFDPSVLNFKQKFSYDFITTWVDECIRDPEHIKQIFINIAGRAGCGKSFWLNMIIHYIEVVKGLTNFVKVGAPTANAAFIVKGETIHALLRIPPKYSKEYDLPDLKIDRVKSQII